MPLNAPYVLIPISIEIVCMSLWYVTKDFTTYRGNDYVKNGRPRPESVEAAIVRR